MNGIRISVDGDEHSFPQSEVLIGRQSEGIMVHLDLHPDLSVSRRHARVWVEGGIHWVEDLGSTGGTVLDGRQIRGAGPQKLAPANTLLIGRSALTVRLEPPEVAVPPPPAVTRPLEPPAPPPPAAPVPGSVTVPPPPSLTSSAAVPQSPSPTASLGSPSVGSFSEPPPPRPAPPPPVSPPPPVPAPPPPQVSALPLPITTRLSLSDEADPLTLLELVSEELSGSAVINDALQRVTEHLVEQFPKVQRACFLLGSEMLLVAHHPGDSRPSTQLSEQAMLRREAFTWPPVLQPGLTQAGPALGPTQWHYQVGAALYAPLLIGGKALGCLCAENSLPDAPFSSEDLRLMRAVAAQAALALDRGLLRTQVERTEEVLENFQKLVPTQIGSRLRQHRGRIRPGGEFCEVTVMFADVRGFTQLSSSMRADEITEMIGIYFDRLVPVLSAHHGMVDKYVGDAIMAIFGSPDADPEHALHAVQAALQMQAAVSQLNQQRRTSGETLWEVGIGIHCGEALHGFSGTRERMEFTVIGNTVNRASRFCDGARGGEVLISPEVHQRVWRGLRNQIEAIRTSIPTKHEGDIQAYQVMPVQRVTP